MTRTNRFSSVAPSFAFSLFSVGLIATCVGCSADVAPDAASLGTDTFETASADHEALIHYKDDRLASTFRVVVVGTDLATGRFVGGTVTAPGPITGSGTKKQFGLRWNEDGLFYWFYFDAVDSEPNSLIHILDTSIAPHRFGNLRVTVEATINGSCHTDYENIIIDEGNDLDFNGWGASFNGTCWVNPNMLRSTKH